MSFRISKNSANIQQIQSRKNRHSRMLKIMIGPLPPTLAVQYDAIKHDRSTDDVALGLG